MIAHPNLIGGEWLRGEPVPNVNPSDTADVIGEYDHASLSQVHAAVAAARSAWPDWAAAGAQLRSDLLDRIATEILARRDELADLLAREEGKVLADARAEVVRAGQIFKFFSGEPVRSRGERLPSVRAGMHVEITREPVGVVALITPWNFPIAIPAWKIAPALAYGNCVILKPAELTPGCAWALAEIIHRAGVPHGVFNLLNGRGAVLGPVLTDSEVDAISFTGSTGVGQMILTSATKRGARVQLEMGGKNPLVVLDDADLERAAQVALDGAFFSTGQRCTASSRLIVQAGIHDRFVETLRHAMRRQVIDDARSPGTTIGPVVDARQLASDLDYIEVGKQQGARLIEGGSRLQRANSGFYLLPALFTEATNQMRISREEIFGPVASVIRVGSYEEALAVANDSPCGLSAGICTTSLKHAEHFKRHVEAGMVMVNVPTAGVDYHVPFGGRKGSSVGPREQGSYAAEFYTTVKTAYVHPG